MNKVFFVLTLFLSSFTLSHEDHSNEELKYILHKFSSNSVACEGSLIPKCGDLGKPHFICSLGYLVNENRCESFFKDFPNGRQPKNSYAWYGGWTCDVGYTKKNKECVLNVNENKEVQKEAKVVVKNELNLNSKSQFVTQVLDKKKIKEELSYYKELFEEELIEKSEYDELRKALLAGIKEGSVTKTIIMNKPNDVAIQSQSDLDKLQEQLALEKRKVEAMESQAQAAQTTNKLIKEQERKKGWNAIMQLGLGIAGGSLSPGGNQRQTNCYDTGSGNFNCTSYDW